MPGLPLAIACLCLSLLLPVAAPAGLVERDAPVTLRQTWNPKPDALDIELSMPCGLKMAFRAVAVPGEPGQEFPFMMGVANADRERRIYGERREGRIAGVFTSFDLPIAWCTVLELSEWQGHTVYLMGKYEVSQAQWDAVMNETCPAPEPEPAPFCPQAPSCRPPSLRFILRIVPFRPGAAVQTTVIFCEGLSPFRADAGLQRIGARVPGTVFFKTTHKEGGMMKGPFFVMAAVLALVFGFVGVASVRAEFCGDIPKLQQEAQAGRPQAQMELSSCYAWGKGVPKDSNLMEDWLRKAAEQGYAPAQLSLGNVYRSKDEQQAGQWYRKAAQGLPALAKQGDASAQYALGMLYNLGEGGLPEDIKLASQWYRKSADQGYAFAQSSLGHMYRIGRGMPKDAAAAAAWERKAADQGVPAAQFALGQMYEHGEGVPHDFNEAEKWYRKAGEFIPGARNKAFELQLKKPCLSKCLADANTCKAGCMGVDKADRATCNDLCAEAQKACNDSCR